MRVRADLNSGPPVTLALKLSTASHASNLPFN
jgi:hypothetical protein